MVVAYHEGQVNPGESAESALNLSAEAVTRPERALLIDPFLSTPRRPPPGTPLRCRVLNIVQMCRARFSTVESVSIR